MSSVKSIIFDMGGVLLDINKQACVDRFVEIGYPQAADLLNPYKQSGIFLKLEEGSISNEEFYDFIRKDGGIDVEDEVIVDALNRFVVGLPTYKLDMLLDLRKRFNVYMLSNTNAVMMPSLRSELFTQQGKTIDHYFDKLYLSYQMGCVKPHREIFEKMLSDGLFTPEQALFIDDGEANIDMAAKMGFKTYLAKEREDFRAIFNDI